MVLLNRPFFHLSTADNVIAFRFSSVKATSHSMIFHIPMRPLREDQKQRHRFTRKRRPATPVMVIISFNFARYTLPTHRNR